MPNTEVLSPHGMTSNALPDDKQSLDTEGKVKHALEDPEFVWRTVPGLVKDTQLPEDAIRGVLDRMPSDVLVTSVGKQGRLFTTRRHYESKQSFLGKFLSAASGTLK